MKRLSINWVPGTVIVMSLTVATSQSGVNNLEGVRTREVDDRAPRSKVIVISGDRRLRAEVTTAVPARR